MKSRINIGLDFAVLTQPLQNIFDEYALAAQPYRDMPMMFWLTVTDDDLIALDEVLMAAVHERMHDADAARGWRRGGTFSL